MDHYHIICVHRTGNSMNVTYSVNCYTRNNEYKNTFTCNKLSYKNGEWIICKDLKTNKEGILFLCSRSGFYEKFIPFPTQRKRNKILNKRN